jgi:hypothetical protein
MVRVLNNESKEIIMSEWQNCLGGRLSLFDPEAVTGPRNSLCLIDKRDGNRRNFRWGEGLSRSC